MHVLSISDNGIGMPRGFILEHSESLGLQIVQKLVRQINGSIKHIDNNGSEFRIEFD